MAGSGPGHDGEGEAGGERWPGRGPAMTEEGDSAPRAVIAGLDPAIFCGPGGGGER